VQSGGRGASPWWREISRLQDGTGGGEGVAQKVGDGVGTVFWSDLWLVVPLSERLSRLYDLSLHRSCTVAEINALRWGEGGAAWAWRRQLWAWEEELLGELRSALTNFVMQPNVLDQWVW
jgi:hypothetical protein